MSTQNTLKAAGIFAAGAVLALCIEHTPSWISCGGDEKPWRAVAAVTTAWHISPASELCEELMDNGYRRATVQAGDSGVRFSQGKPSPEIVVARGEIRGVLTLASFTDSTDGTAWSLFYVPDDGNVSVESVMEARSEAVERFVDGELTATDETVDSDEYREYPVLLEGGNNGTLKAMAVTE